MSCRARSILIYPNMAKFYKTCKETKQSTQYMIKQNTCNKKVKDFHWKSQYIPLYTEWPSSNYIIISVLQS